MQQLAQDIEDMEALLLPLCTSMMTWNAGKLYEEFQEAAMPMTTLVSLLLNNKQVLAQCGVDVDEPSILEILECIASALETKDEIRLLDSVYHGYLPWLQGVGAQIRLFLSGQEGQS
jgi:hypothetical protein